MYPPSKRRILSGHSMMIRACRSLQIPRSPGRICNIGFSGTPLGCSYRLLLLSSPPWQNSVSHPSSWRWKSGKRFVLSKRSVFSTAIKRPPHAAAADGNSLCRWTGRPTASPQTSPRAKWRSSPSARCSVRKKCFGTADICQRGDFSTVKLRLLFGCESLCDFYQFHCSSATLGVVSL